MRCSGAALETSVSQGSSVWSRAMTTEEAKKVIEQTRSFIGRIYAHEVVLDGPFKPLELEAILFLMRNRPAPHD
jgi:hypothetical protein